MLGKSKTFSFWLEKKDTGRSERMFRGEREIMRRIERKGGIIERAFFGDRESIALTGTVKIAIM
jgi:hypothetical protein